jgi:hypothetical protein
MGFLQFVGALSVAFMFAFALPTATKMKDVGRNLAALVLRLTGLLPIGVVCLWLVHMGDQPALVWRPIVGLVGASFGEIAFLALGEWLSPADTQKLPAYATLESAARELPVLTITGVGFDPNSATEMYVDFEVANPGKPTVIRDWNLVITSPNGQKVQDLNPRFVVGGKTVTGPYGKVIMHSDLTDAPLATGDRRTGCRLGFTILGDAPKKRFGTVGTSFEVTAKDVSGNSISAIWIMPKQSGS